MKWSWKLGEFRGIGVFMHALLTMENVGELVAIRSAVAAAGARSDARR
ncbi:MAG TPA: hypothetical protein VMS86_10470 [Thermoanaerobaculia bacterium]|nr:hypothetical protein [Thermoanaerobaculia bacterium]